MTTRPNRAEAAVYPDDLLLQIQRLLAVMADLDVHYESQRECLESWPGPRQTRERLLAELERCHRDNLERLASSLAGLQSAAAVRADRDDARRAPASPAGQW